MLKDTYSGAAHRRRLYWLRALGTTLHTDGASLFRVTISVEKSFIYAFKDK